MRKTGENTFCDEIGELLEPYLDGDLPREEAERVRASLHAPDLFGDEDPFFARLRKRSAR
jgi:hypothetical protein